MQIAESFKALNFIQHLNLLAHGIKVKTNDIDRSPLSYNGFDSWLGADFDYFLDNLLDGFLQDIEDDLLSVWSTNRSEQESQ